MSNFLPFIQINCESKPLGLNVIEAAVPVLAVFGNNYGQGFHTNNLILLSGPLEPGPPEKAKSLGIKVQQDIDDRV